MQKSTVYKSMAVTAGCYEYSGYIYIVYGGADCCTLAARVSKTELLNALENSQDIKDKP